MPGLPGARLIPDGWEAHHAPVPEGAMTAECRVTRPATTPGQPTFDETTGRSVYPDPPEVYAGPCRVQRARISGTQDPVIGGKATPLRLYEVSAPLAAPPLRVNDIVEITAATDHEFAGALMRVTDVRGGSLVWDRWYDAEQWTPTTR